MHTAGGLVVGIVHGRAALADLHATALQMSAQDSAEAAGIRAALSAAS